MHINEVPKVLAESSSVTIHAIQVAYPFDAAYPLIIPLQLCSVTSYFDVYSLNIAEYENEDVLQIHLTAKKPPWDPLTNQYSEREICMLDQ